MTRTKAGRQRAIAEIIRSRSIGSQEELAERLAASGFRATQATVSRDLEELGAVKVRGQDGVGYAMPSGNGQPRLPRGRLESIFREWVRSVEPAASLVVVRTQPGSAHLVAAALDQTELAGVVGTVSGDDTLFVAARSGRSAGSLAELLRGLVGPPG